MLINLRRYSAFLAAHSTYICLLGFLYTGARFPIFLISLPIIVLSIPFLSSAVCFRLTSFTNSKYGTVYYRLLADGSDYYIRTYKYKFGLLIKENDSRNFTITLDEGRDFQLIKDMVISTKEKTLSKVDKRKLKEKTLKAVQKRLMNNDLSIHSSDEEFLTQLKQL